MTESEFILSLINEQISKVNNIKTVDVNYYEDYESYEDAYLDGIKYGRLEELEYLKKQFEFLLK